MQKPKRFFLPAEHIDISHWGVAALICGAVAVMAANLSALVPAHALGGLHAPYREGGSYNQMRAQIAELEEDRNRAMSDYRALLARFNLLDDDGDEIIRRLAAVEMSLPLLIESLPLDSDIDRSLLTASITETAGEVYEVDGNKMVVRYSPLFDDVAADRPPDQPMPPALAPEIIAPVSAGPTVDTTLQGITIGGAIPGNEAKAAYSDIAAAVGMLLLGTAPLLAPAETEGEAHIVLGPLPNLSSAESLCQRIERLDFSCDPAPYEGRPLPL